jgi:hypothetical protein
MARHYPVMSAYRQQAMIDVPLPKVWELVSDVERHPEWWPRVVKVQCEGIEQGCEYRQVTATPMGKIETDIRIEELEDCRTLNVRCLDTGTFCRWLLTEAQDGTFIDAEFGMDPQGLANRVFDAVAGKRYFRRWLESALDGLREAAGERPAA